MNPFLGTKKYLSSWTTALLVLCAGVHPAAAQSSAQPWVADWTVGPGTYTLGPADNGLNFNGQTERQILHTSVAGTAARIHLSNQYGLKPITIRDVHIAQVSSDSSIISSTDRTITFNGLASVTIAVGASVVSDAVAFAAPAQADVAVSLYFPSSNGTITQVTAHEFTEQTNYYAVGDVSGSVTMPNTQTTDNYHFLTGLDVQNAGLSNAVVALGASIVAGIGSSQNENHRWPDLLAQRLGAARIQLGVANMGIAGNELLADNGEDGISAQNRFGRDVLSQAGAKYVIFSDDPINDLEGNPSTSLSSLEQGLESLISRAHSGGLKFFCSTLTPYGGSGHWTQQGETTREGYNAFVRSAASGCDGVVDEDTATHDPNNPTVYRAAFDSGDHVHPNDAGHQAIANAVNLGLFEANGVPPIKDPGDGGCGAILAGEGLKENQYVTSCDGRFQLWMQGDGNVVVYQGYTPIWNTNTSGAPASELTLLADGNLCLYDTKGNVLWQSGTAGLQGVEALLQDDGNWVLYNSTSANWDLGL